MRRTRAAAGACGRDVTTGSNKCRPGPRRGDSQGEALFHAKKEAPMLQSQPVKTYRVTWEELMSRRSEIAPDAVLEVRVYEPEAAPQAETKLTAKTDPGIALLESWIAAAPTDPEEIRLAQAEREEFMQNLNRNRIESGERPLFP